MSKTATVSYIRVVKPEGCPGELGTQVRLRLTQASLDPQEAGTSQS